ncbi:MAG: TonB-dependent receptor [Acidobacteriia bacterium]|nr:TonB-dependent receptor [Terriglobia bacterium]
MSAAERGTWTAVLRNNLGGPIAGATVQVRSGGYRASARTGEDGRFVFTLEVGAYAVTAEFDGRTAAAPDALSVPGAGAPGVLQWGADGVLSPAPAELREATGGEQLSGKAVSGLPLNKRDFSQLLLLAAGAMTDSNGAANFTQQFAINGQRGTAAVFAMDGADISDPEMGGATFSNLNVDAVAEIRSSSGWMPAEIGRGAAGFTNIVTRSGSNAVHGSIFEFLRNAALDARNFFDRRSPASPGRIPPFARNEFGLTNAGPVVVPGIYNGRGRTYYAVEYQGFRQVLGSTQVIPVPTAEERAGRDTTAFPGDTLFVPVDERIARLIGRYPLPNDPQGPYGVRTYATSSKVATTSDQASVRIDHRLSGKAQLFGRFTADNITGPTTNPSQTAIDPSFGVRYIDRQRNAVLTYTRTPSPGFVWEASVSYTRATPSFPAQNTADPALKFGDGLYEAFNNSAGLVVAAYGNLFQARQNFTWVRGRHTMKAGGEARANRDTTLFGLSPNGEYQFGGGTAYAPVAIRSASGAHDLHPGDPLPDALTGLLTASAFTYTTAVAPLLFAQGERIGGAAVRRDAYNAYVQDSWRISPRLLLNYGLRYEITTPGASAPGSELLINPQPGYRLDKRGWGPRVGMEWRAGNTVLRAGGAVTTLLVNLWQDNSLTGSNPFVVYPRLTAAPGQPIRFGTTITPQQLPAIYTTAGSLVFAAGDSRQTPANTLMDVQRFERDLSALSPDGRITPLTVSGIARNFSGGYMGTWTAGLEQRFAGATLNAAYVGTAGIHLPAMDYPNGYTGASPAFAPYTQFDSSGRIVGGYGPVMLITNRSHSTYHALQLSGQKELSSSGLGFQASYTWSKSIDDASAVIGGFVSGSSGAAALTSPQDPFRPGMDKGPSVFDTTQAFTFSLFQELHAERAPVVKLLGRRLTAGWQVLGMGTALSGSPFTIYSGVQQTGVGAGGADRPDQSGSPRLSTSRTVREDYFGLGDGNASFFRIPVQTSGGTGPNQGRFGAVGRNTFRGPGFRNLDAAMIKDTPLGRRSGGEFASLQFRAEFFNIFNLVNFGLPSNIVLGPGFGQSSRTAGSSRQIQFALKVIY